MTSVGTTTQADGVKVDVIGVGFVAPGMDGWAAARAVLRGETEWAPSPLPKFKPALLPANERRRATWLVQLALRAVEDCLGNPLRVGQEDCLGNPTLGANEDCVGNPPVVDMERLASVFASSGGDMNNLHALCEQLARDPKGISPTAFHNSVHNAVAGYFGIGAVARASSVSLSAHDDTFTAGLLEAFSWVLDRGTPVLLVAYDAVAPMPLFAKRPVDPDVAVAFLLAPSASSGSGSGGDGARASIELLPADDAAVPSAVEDAALEQLRTGNPAARALPLLQLLANARSGHVVIGERAQRWQLRVRCP